MELTKKELSDSASKEIEQTGLNIPPGTKMVYDDQGKIEPVSNNYEYPPPLKGGQGRSVESLKRDCFTLGFLGGIGFLLAALGVTWLIWEWF